MRRKEKRKGKGSVKKRGVEEKKSRSNVNTNIFPPDCELIYQESNKKDEEEDACRSEHLRIS